MRAVKLLVASAAVAAGMFVATSPASASHNRYHCTVFAYHPLDLNSYTCATKPAGFYRACDYDSDNHRVRGWIDVAGSEHHRLTAWAPEGGGCTEPAGVQYGGGYILSIRSCTENEGCSGWVRVR